MDHGLITDVNEDLLIARVCVSPLSAIIFLSHHPVTCPFSCQEH